MAVEIEQAEWDKVQSVIGKVDGLQSDLQKERQLRQEAEAARDLALAQKAPADDVTQKATEAAKAVIAEQQQQTVADNAAIAERNFLNTHKEFHPDNDTGGIKYAAFKAKLARINTSGLKSVDDFSGAYSEALTLLNPAQAAPQRVVLNGSTPSGTGTGPTEVKQSQLSSKEVGLLNQMGWTEERYLKIKDSKPHYVETLLKMLP